MNYSKELTEFCMGYSKELGLFIGRTHPDNYSSGVYISIPKKRLRSFCKDQLDEQEYTEVKTFVFNLLRAVMAKSNWGKVVLDERGMDYNLGFHPE